ncbi:GNAT family N-acetyltransferase [Roseibium sp. Sym1]|uniref:GNAT family N-acetyltransferase n=1 Tax=Roseibium sp. Sym1 TaxID=3016006 RepID=UPI0022B33C42|nr:GNAT family N-acetyltransferase [Roseibium sp. Sym1]
MTADKAPVKCDIPAAKSLEPGRPISVVSLETCPDQLDRIELWFADAWPGWYGPGGQGDAHRDLDRCLASRDRLPRCLVAFDTGRRPVGTVSLRDSSPGSDRYPGAWLTALLVPETCRRAGIGTALVAAAEREAREVGFGEIHASTASAQSLFLARDWQPLDTLAYPEGELEVFRKVFSLA